MQEFFVVVSIEADFYIAISFNNILSNKGKSNLTLQGLDLKQTKNNRQNQAKTQEMKQLKLSLWSFLCDLSLPLFASVC